VVKELPYNVSQALSDSGAWPNRSEHYVLSEQDISLIRQRRGDYNRLEIAVQLALLRPPFNRNASG